jgi:hypothetical protein
MILIWVSSETSRRDQHFSCEKRYEFIKGSINSYDPKEPSQRSPKNA